MTEEKLVERVTALFADSDAAQRKMIRLYAETNDAIEASAIIDSGAEVLHMLQGGLRPEVLVLDSVLSDTTIFPLLRSIRQQQIEYEPHIIVTLMPSAAPQIEKILTLGAECTIFKPYSLPELFDTVYQTAASGPRLNRYLVHESVTAQLRTLLVATKTWPMVSITCRKPCILRSATARRVPWGSCAPKQGSRLA